MMSKSTKSSAADDLIKSHQQQSLKTLLDRFDRNLVKISAPSAKSQPGLLMDKVATPDNSLPL